ncbi:MAG: AAA family ATPase [Betaproteobacteria bacterium AqS2]|uniref:AAA family ATPase n=1 Tax=Candidatus Amphirhobacter heronislandensis TaxID=1732024 RepID=A0A930XXW5_9GAMM|nr:AAA family ATPase [Betaproteobacteria bacterium AqS2]
MVRELDKHVIGQAEAKRCIATAYRSRWRRLQVPDEALRADITPKNILMVGPTGVGKTEIARRIAKMSDSPFIKVEATKFTQVGYVGRDVDSIVRDLMAAGVKMAEDLMMKRFDRQAEEHALKAVVDKLQPLDDAERKKLEIKIEGGGMDDESIEIEYQPLRASRVDVNVPENMPPEFASQMDGIMQQFTQALQQGQKKKREKIPIPKALKYFKDRFLEGKLDRDAVVAMAKGMVEQRGIVFLDEIDKIAGSEEIRGSHDVSRLGVQRDLLPLLEGASPNDLIPEMQGRLPVRVNLKALTVEDFIAILSKTEHSLLRQYQALLATEGVKVTFTESCVKRLAELAHQTNAQHENIGARRLHTMLERLMEEVSYEATSGDKRQFTPEDVDKTIGQYVDDDKLAKLFL